MTVLDQYRTALGEGRERRVPMGRHKQLDQLQDALRRRDALERARELRRELGLPETVESGWTGDPSSTTVRDPVAEDLADVEEEIARLEHELGRPPPRSGE